MTLWTPRIWKCRSVQQLKCLIPDRLSVRRLSGYESSREVENRRCQKTPMNRRGTGGRGTIATTHRPRARMRPSTETVGQEHERSMSSSAKERPSSHTDTVGSEGRKKSQLIGINKKNHARWSSSVQSKDDQFCDWF